MQMPGGMADQMGLRAIDCDPAEHRAVFESAILPVWMRNPMGWLHGGMVAALLDSAMGIHAALYNGGTATPTVNLNLNYLYPTPADGKLHVGSRMIKFGRSLVFAEAALWAEKEEQPCATASGVFHLPTAVQP